MKAHYTLASDPMRVDVALRDFREVPDGSSLADLLPALSDGWICNVIGPDYPEGAYIARAHWHHAPPPGHLVCFHRPALGGGQGSNPLRMVLMIAMMVALPQLAPALKLSGLFLEVSSSVITAAGAIAGSALINALVPLDSSNVGATAGGAQAYSVSAQGNQARIDQVIPELFGRNFTYPDYAAQPYSLFLGPAGEMEVAGDQYLYVVLLVGTGQYQIQRISNETTPLTSYSDVQIIRVGPGQSTLDGPGTGVETLAEQTLVQTNVVTSPIVTNQEMEHGRFTGPYAVCPPEREVESIGVDMLLPRGLDDGLEVTWRVQYQLIDDFDRGIGPWLTLADETYDTASPMPIRISYEYPVAPGRYQVSFTRTDARSTDSGSNHDISVIGLRGTLTEVGIDYDAGTYVVVKARATGQINGALRIRVVSDRMLPVWDSDGWSAPEVTRNPAWALARVLKARELDDEQIDIDQLQALAATWEGRYDHFDYAFDTVSTMWDALALVSRVGRAVPLIRGGAYTFWRDQQEVASVAAFTQRNIRRGTFRLGFSFPEQDAVQALEVEYVDNRRWDWVTITAQWYGDTVHTYRGDLERVALGLPVPNKPARIRAPGIIGEKHARRFAAFHLADMLYRPNRAKFSTELAGLLPAYGSLVSISHDVGNFGAGRGDVVDWDAGTLTLEVSEPIPWVTGGSHYVRLIKPDGTLTDALPVTPGAGNSMVLGVDPGFVPVYDDPDRTRSHYLFGTADTLEGLAKVRVIAPASEREIALELVLEDDRVHSADAAWMGDDAIFDAGDTPDSGGYVVYMASDGIGSLAAGPDKAAAAVQFQSDGLLRYASRSYAPGDVLSGEVGHLITNEWLQPAPVTTTIAGRYEVRATVLAVGDPANMYGTFDTWLSLSTTREFEYRGEGGTFESATVRIEIRDVATETIQLTKTIYLTTSAPPEGGGGA